MSIASVLPSRHLILCHPLLLPSIFRGISIFSIESALHISWPKYWSFSISPSSEYPQSISFRMDWLDLLAVQGILKSSPAPQFERISSLALSLYGQLSQLYMTTGKTIAFTTQILVGKLMSLFFNKLSRLLIASLPRPGIF